MISRLCILLLLVMVACGRGSHPSRPGSDDVATASPLGPVMEATEQVRVRLSTDTTDGLPGAAEQVATRLKAVAPSLKGEQQADVGLAVAAARDLAATADISAARAAFSRLNEALFPLVAADPSLQADWHAFRCPMAPGFQKWFQEGATLQNPYFGLSMTSCGEATSWGDRPAAAPADPDEIVFWTCPMHPTVHPAEAGACPICGMALVPVTRAEAETGVVRIDQDRRQAFGVRTDVIAEGPLVRELRATGRVVPDETRLYDVTLRIDGWIRDLRVDQTGQEVRRGQVLFTLYSPDLYAAQQELLAVGGRDPALAKAARDRLRLWGLVEAQIADIEQRGQPIEDVPILAPASGRVLDKEAVTGMRVMAGQRLYRLAPLDPIWVEAEVYESDVPWVSVGQSATVTQPHVPGKQLQGTITFLQPTIDPVTRTRQARVELANPDLALLPEMVADVTVRADLGRALLLPEEAVIFTGPRRVVFVDEGDGRLAPREVRLGRRGDHSYEVLDGLLAGDRVVVSGNFLVAAESRIRSSSGSPGGHEAH